MADPLRLFVAVWPPDQVSAALAALDIAPETGVRPVQPQNWHVTLRFLGSADPGIVHDRLVDADLPRVEAALGPAVERLGRHQLVVPTHGVDGLAARVAEVTRGLGEAARRPFRGHLTMARTKPDAPSAAIGRPIRQRFVVHEISLVASELTPRGAVYTTLDRYPTRAADSERLDQE